MLKTFRGAQRATVGVVVMAAMALSACSSSNDSQFVGVTPTPPPTIAPGPTVPPPATPEPGEPSPSPTMEVSPSPTTTEPPATPPPAAALTPFVYGIRRGPSADELVRFSPSAPTVLRSYGSFASGLTIVGLDRRPADNNLYAVSHDGRVFIVNVINGLTPSFTTTEIQSLLEAPSSGGAATTDLTLPGPVAEARINADFNPVANALRLVADRRASPPPDLIGSTNLRVPPAALTNPAPAPAVGTFVDGTAGYSQGVTVAAYTNPAPTALPPPTELFVIDATSERIRTIYRQTNQPPPGAEPVPGVTPNGADDGGLFFVARLDEDDVEGLTSIDAYDIFQAVAGGTNEHYLLARGPFGTRIYQLPLPLPMVNDGNVSLATATRVTFNQGQTYTGLVVNATPPTDTVNLLLNNPRRAFLLNSGGASDTIDVVAFNPAVPLTVGVLNPPARFPIVGLQEGERLVGIDSRTTSRAPNRVNTLYGVTTQNRVVALRLLPDDSATSYTVTDAIRLEDASRTVVPLAGTQFGVDFNPEQDLLRIVSNTGQNLRVNLENGRTIDGATRADGFAAVDRRLRVIAPWVGEETVEKQTAQLVATAYRGEGPVDRPDGFQFAIDAENSTLVRVVSPNDGALVEVGPLNLDLPRNDHPLTGLGAGRQGFDIGGVNDSLALASLRSTAGRPRSALYSINLSTGAATLIDDIGPPPPAPQLPVDTITIRLE